MLEDSSGLEITTDSTEAVTAINGFVDQLLGVGNDAQIIFQAVEADPVCAIANAHAAAFYLLSGKSDALTLAMPYLNAAKANLARANEREQLYVAAIDAWAKRDLSQAIAYHEAISDRYPRDLASVHIGQYHYRNVGNSQGLLQIAEKVFPANRENPYMYGMLAFGLEECHRLTEAEAAGRQAVEMKRHNPWAHHAVAHVLEGQLIGSWLIVELENIQSSWGGGRWTQRPGTVAQARGRHLRHK